jgi:hypothetical protein
MYIKQKTKEQSKEWRQWYPMSKKFKAQKSSSKALTSLFWDKYGIMLVDYPKKGETITAKYYVAMFDKLKKQHLLSNC